MTTILYRFKLKLVLKTSVARRVASMLSAIYNYGFCLYMSRFIFNEIAIMAAWIMRYLRVVDLLSSLHLMAVKLLFL